MQGTKEIVRKIEVRLYLIELDLFSAALNSEKMQIFQQLKSRDFCQWDHPFSTYAEIPENSFYRHVRLNVVLTSYS